MSDTKIKKLIAETFLEVADALETGQYGKQPVIGFASEGSEHGEDNIERAMELAAAKGLKAVLIKGEDIHKDMEKMLDYIDTLNDLDTSGIEPMSHVFPLHNVFREDVVTNEDRKEDILANAPQRKNDSFEVPKTIG